MFNANRSLFIFLCAGIALCCSCHAPAQGYKSPPGYDLDAPVKYEMPGFLLEISGIAFNKGKADTLYAEQDEEGKLYYGDPGKGAWKNFKFAAKGDYEDVAICNEQVVLLRSDGTLFSFPLDNVRQNVPVAARKTEKLLPKGEYEGLCVADEAGSRLAVLCKQCSDDRDNISGHFLRLSANGEITPDGEFHIRVKEVEKLSGNKKLLHPSALNRHPLTGEWYILSSVNKMLIVADSDWQVKAVYHLRRSMFNQPEGLAFDEKGNLYISNEGKKSLPGNILVFNYRKNQ